MIRRITAVIILLITMTTAYAADRYWIATVTTNWNNTANWSTTSGGAGGASVPGSADVAIFNSLKLGRCNIDANVNVAGLSVQTGYTGIITQSVVAGTSTASTITVGTSGATFSAGTFNGYSSNGTGSITFNGAFTVSGGAFNGGACTITCNSTMSISSGTFTSTQNLLRLAGDFSWTGGAFSHNNGTVSVQAALTLTGSVTMKNLQFAPTANSTVVIASGTTIAVNDSLRWAGTGIITLNTGTINAQGNVYITNTATGNAGSVTGTATINLNNTTNAQTITSSVAQGKGILPKLTIAKSTAALTLSGNITIGGDLTYTSSGTVTSSGSKIILSPQGTQAVTVTQSGGLSLTKLTFDNKAANTTTIGGTSGVITTTDSLTLAGGSLSLTLNTGTINAQGHVTVTNTGTTGGGTTTININGAGNQTLKGGTTVNQGVLPQVTINKSSNTLTLSDVISVGGNWTHSAGTLSTGSSTVAFVRTLTVNSTVAQALNNVTFSAGSGTITYTISSGTILTVNGMLTVAGAGSAVFNTGTIEAKGSITLTNSAFSGGGSATLKVNGSGTQTINGITFSTGSVCKLPHFTIQKVASDTLKLRNYMAVAGNWTYTSGIIDHGTSTVILVNTKNVSGTHALYNVTFNGQTSTFSTNTYTIGTGNTLTINGTLQTNGVGGLKINGGAITANGNIDIFNQHTNSGGSTPITIGGGNSQVLKGSGLVDIGKLGSTTIDKTGGTLTFNSIISVAGSFTYIAGNVDASTNATTFAMCGTGNLDAQGTSSTLAFYDLNIYKDTTTLGGNLITARNLTVGSSGRLQAGAYSQTVSGNWSNSGIYIPGTSTVIFTGTSSPQTITKSSGTESMYVLQVNKSAGNLQLSSPVTVTSALTLTLGKIVTTSTNLLTLDNNATSTAGTNASFVSGPMKKVGSQAFTFPLGGTSGGTNYYHPLAITAPSVSTDAFIAEYIMAKHTGIAKADSVSQVDTCEYWTLARSAGTSNVIATLQWNTNSCSTADLDDLTMVGWDGSKWFDQGISNRVVNDNGTGTVTSLLTITFPINPVPITIGKKEPPLFYVPLSKRLDGIHYRTFTKKLYLKYDEKYRDGTLTYKIYDSQNNAINTSSITVNKNYGANWLVIDLAPVSSLSLYSFYIIEVENDKGQKEYARFKFF